MAKTKNTKLSVALVTMPFISVQRPSMQVGLLKSIASKHGFQTSTFHLCLDFAHQIGFDLYEQLTHHRGRMIGDWIFSIAAFDGTAPDQDDNLLSHFKDEVDMLLHDLKLDENRLKCLKSEEAPRFIDRILNDINWGNFDVVGFSCTFQQTVASLALAKKIKAEFPQVITLFGGANFEGEMGLELVRSFSCIDYAVIGEGDVVFPEFLSCLEQNNNPATVPGVACCQDGIVNAPTTATPLTDLNSLPLPDYDEYFDRVESLGILTKGGRREVYLPFESSRGCWWGQKHHCTFCGLNGTSMKYRSKAVGQVLNELTELTNRYRSFTFEAVDNIMDMAYLTKFFTPLIEKEISYKFFYEVKSNLSREQIRLLRQGGIIRLQPGIESLSSHVLKLMNKGVTAIQNVNFLRWALYYGIDVGWNMIYGFPNEAEEDYERQFTLLSHLFHLQPPVGFGRIWMERFSPIFFNRKAFPAKHVQAEASYSYVYPAYVDVNKVAYFFDYELENTLSSSVYEKTQTKIKEWKESWKGTSHPTLNYWFSPGFLQIEDLRVPSSPGTYTFQDPLASIYRAFCDKPSTANGLKQALSWPWPIEEIEESLDEFCKQGLMMRDGNQFLALATPAAPGR
jgi:ribosomal peptide maturation radical SAM protein 1